MRRIASASQFLGFLFATHAIPPQRAALYRTPANLCAIAATAVQALEPDCLASGDSFLHLVSSYVCSEIFPVIFVCVLYAFCQPHFTQRECKEPGMFPALRSVCGVSKDVHPASFSIFPTAAIKGYVQMILLQNRPLALSFRCPCDISITDSLRMYTDEPLHYYRSSNPDTSSGLPCLW